MWKPINGYANKWESKSRSKNQSPKKFIYWSGGVIIKEPTTHNRMSFFIAFIRHFVSAGMLSISVCECMRIDYILQTFHRHGEKVFQYKFYLTIDVLFDFHLPLFNFRMRFLTAYRSSHFCESTNSFVYFFPGPSIRRKKKWFFYAIFVRHKILLSPQKLGKMKKREQCAAISMLTTQ